MSRGSDFKGQFARLRGEYDTAFRALCRAMTILQEGGEDMASVKQNVEAARTSCNRARNALAALLLDRKFEAMGLPEVRKRGIAKPAKYRSSFALLM